MVTFPEPAWRELLVPVFLERFVLTVLAGVLVTIIVMNPFKLSGAQQVGAAIVVIGLALFVGATVVRVSRVASTPTTGRFRPVLEVLGHTMDERGPTVTIMGYVANPGAPSSLLGFTLDLRLADRTIRGEYIDLVEPRTLPFLRTPAQPDGITLGFESDLARSGRAAIQTGETLTGLGQFRFQGVTESDLYAVGTTFILTVHDVEGKTSMAEKIMNGQPPRLDHRGTHVPPPDVPLIPRGR